MTTTATTKDMELPSVEDRDYHCMRLENDLDVLLISDPDTDKAAAAMDVLVGSLSDGETQGLAHYCEHMLFMGSEKFPDENEYNKYLSAHGGDSNAFTSQENTRYYFNVNASDLEGALDRFAQFFIGPLMDSSCLSRELQAVDSEHAKNQQQDYWRTFQLSKQHLAQPSHPYARFGNGNRVSLNDDETIRQTVLQFYRTYYLAPRMKLCILGQDSIDDLKRMALEYFGPVQGGTPPPAVPPIQLQTLPQLLHVVPVRTAHSLELQFPCKATKPHYRSKPSRYWSHLLGHESRGSILSVLKDLHYADELSAGESASFDDWSIFSVHIELTLEGLKHVQEVIEIVFSYLKTVKTPHEWVFQETATVADLQFRFLSKKSPMDYVSTLAGAMHLYPPPLYLAGGYKIYEYDAELFQEFQTDLRPDNCFILVSSKEFASDTDLQAEEWYGTEYAVKTIPNSLLQTWNNPSMTTWALAFPEHNDMIATDFELFQQAKDFPKDHPVLLRDDVDCRFWYKPDNQFRMPKLNVMIHLWTRVAYEESPESAVATALWNEVLHELTNEFAYLASMAGLHCGFLHTSTGIEIHVSGYNHKLHVLLQRIVDTMVELPNALTDELFDRIKDKLSKHYLSFLVSDPYHHGFYGLELCVDRNKWSVHDRMEALQTCTKSDVVHISKRLLSRLYMEILVNGNASPEEAHRLSDILVQGIHKDNPHFASNLPQSRVVQLQAATDYLYRFAEFNDENMNSCLAALFQLGPVNLLDNAKLAVLAHLMKEPAFQELRTEEQLGYIVHTSVQTYGADVKSLLILVQSDAYDPLHLDERVTAFVDRFRSTMVNMTEEDFCKHIQALAKSLREKRKNLGEESIKYWRVIGNQSYLFQRLSLIADRVETISKAAALQFYDRCIARGAPQRRKLTVQVFCKNHAAKMNEPVPDGVVVVTDPVEFQREMNLYALPKKVNVDELKWEKDN